MHDTHRLFAVHDGHASRFALDGFAVGDGWFGILDDMATRIEQRCADTGVDLPQVVQVKEKMGLLRVDVRPSYDALHDILVEAERRSVSTPSSEIRHDDPQVARVRIPGGRDTGGHPALHDLITQMPPPRTEGLQQNQQVDRTKVSKSAWHSNSLKCLTVYDRSGGIWVIRLHDATT